MKLEEGMRVIYECEAKVESLKDNDIQSVTEIGDTLFPTIQLKIFKIKKVINNLNFLDDEDVLRKRYRIRYFLIDKERVDNECYDFERIWEDTERIKKEYLERNENEASDS